MCLEELPSGIPSSFRLKSFANIGRWDHEFPEIVGRFPFVWVPEVFPAIKRVWLALPLALSAAAVTWHLAGLARFIPVAILLAATLGLWGMARNVTTRV